MFKGFLNFFQAEMPTPGFYGWFHLLWIGIMISACVAIFFFRKRISTRALNNTLLGLGIAFVILEVIKQVIYSFNIDGAGNITFDYKTHAFPFQFCSTPMYLMLLAGILRKGKIYEALLSYLATFALIGGMIVMVCPGDVLGETIYINIQTMVWHASMVVLAFLILVTRHVEFNYKTLFKAGIVFVCMLGIALLLNTLAHFIAPDKEFNMFLIGPYQPCSLLILQDIYPVVPWIIFFLLYVALFVGAAALVLSIAILCDRLSRKAQNKKQVE